MISNRVNELFSEPASYWQASEEKKVEIREILYKAGITKFRLCWRIADKTVVAVESLGDKGYEALKALIDDGQRVDAKDGALKVSILFSLSGKERKEYARGLF